MPYDSLLKTINEKKAALINTISLSEIQDLSIRKDFRMTEFNRKAGVLWTGDLKNGNGLISTESKVIYELPYTYQTGLVIRRGLTPKN